MVSFGMQTSHLHPLVDPALLSAAADFLPLSFAHELFKNTDAPHLNIPPHKSTLYTVKLITKKWTGISDVSTFSTADLKTATHLVKTLRAILPAQTDDGDFQASMGRGYQWSGNTWRLELSLYGTTLLPGAEGLAQELASQRLSITLNLLNARANRRRGELSKDDRIILTRSNAAFPNPNRRAALKRQHDQIQAHLDTLKGHTEPHAARLTENREAHCAKLRELMQRAQY